MAGLVMKLAEGAGLEEGCAWVPPLAPPPASPLVPSFVTVKR